jgi:hypothetical protein
VSQIGNNPAADAKGKRGTSDEVNTHRRSDANDNTKGVVDSVDIWNRFNHRGKYARRAA